MMIVLQLIVIAHLLHVSASFLQHELIFRIFDLVFK